MVAAAGVLGITIVAGCGTAAPRAGEGGGPTGSVVPQGCAGAIATATALATIRLGSAAVPVRMTRAHGACGNALVARVQGRWLTLRLGAVHLERSTARAVTIPGRGQLVLASQRTRLGTQYRLYGVAGGRLGEVLIRAKAPVLPFVPTRAPAAAVWARCTSSGIETIGNGSLPLRTDHTMALVARAYRIVGLTAVPAGTVASGAMPNGAPVVPGGPAPHPVLGNC